MTHAYGVIGWAWLLTAVVWIAGSISNKRSVRKQPSGARLVQMSVAVLGGLMVAGQGTFRGTTILQQTGFTYFLSIVVVLAGLGFAIWSRFALGGNWSANVTIKQEHTLVRTGPYGIVRHPIYSGLLLAVLGTAVARGTSEAFIGVGVLVLAFWLKMRMEEAFMLAQFGSAYEIYRSEVKRLIPFLW